MTTHIHQNDLQTLQVAHQQLIQSQAIWQFTLQRLAEIYQIDQQAGERLDIQSGQILGRSPLCDALDLPADDDFRDVVRQ